MQEYYYDKLLNIKTREDRNQPSGHSIHYHPYEPTPYQALEVFCKQYDVKATDHIVDFGSGKGRLNFFMHYFHQATVTGVEKDERLYREALKNLENYHKKTRVEGHELHFHCCLAEEYEINPTDNRFYFFHPFSIQIFRKIVDRIIQSTEEKMRDVEIILYYPHEEYIYFLEHETVFNLIKEIKLPGLYERNSYERFLVYRLGPSA
ncbi:SAM-dependent methyltransferase [Oceanobacillus piezotolerans]|uniref:SAM-dependent methyltransferase n=1 Tax=Oceanobacillus piezotolerans TaxID=2448030 RepID=A0A498D2U7_9BACI|nr:SAM-dependent methyltransferase [Oceanobacillus piezotolerans]RLL41306.1 SAM-dependent methyltransferase [Oceanobacillus piezotolerans]